MTLHTDQPYDQDDQELTGFAGQRIPPSDIESEKIVLGSMMMSAEASEQCDGLVNAADYYRPRHGIIHQAIVDLRAKGEPAHPQLVCDELERRGTLTQVGGPLEVSRLLDSVPSPAAGFHHARIVRNRAVRRRLAEAGVRITQSAYEGLGEVDELVADASGEIATVAEGAAISEDDDFVTPGDVMEATLDMVEAAQKSDGLSGLGTGLTDLDMLTSGLQPGQMIVVAGRPGMGKSTLAMDFARACVYKHNTPAAFISLEMPVTELTMRLLSAEGRIALHHLRSGTTTDDDWTRMARVMPRVSEGELFINDCATTLEAIQSKLRRLKARRPDLGLVVLDYLQLITLAGRRPDSREREVSEISLRIKNLAKELQLPIVALAQLNRGPEMRSDKKPVVSDLRESGSIEQDADMVILLHREDAYEKESPRSGEADIIVGKHRNGPTATITVAAQLHYSRFVDMAQT